MAVYFGKKINYEDFIIKRSLYVQNVVTNYFSYLAKKIKLENFTIKKSFWIAQSIPNYFVYRSRKVWRVKKT